eukprot:5515057-Lingulodinium_polyedra.AAC.1
MAGGDTPVFPLALYLDGVGYQNRDSCLGIWVVNLVTNRRHLFSVTRKRDRCRCGCGSWCTLHALMSFTAWVVEVLATGRYPR